MLKTKRLTIRPHEEKDLHDVYEIYNEKDVCKYLLHSEWNPKNRQEEFNKKLKNHSLTQSDTLSLAVVCEGKVIGDLSAWYRDMKNTMEIGYSFSAVSGGKGYATEAVGSLVKYLFDEYDVHRIQATLDARNSASQKLCERVGMRKEAHFIQDYWNKNEWTDSIVYGMLNSEHRQK